MISHINIFLKELLEFSTNIGKISKPSNKTLQKILIFEQVGIREIKNKMPKT